MSVVMEVVHVETARAVAAVRDDRTRALATTRMAVAIRASGQKARGSIATKGAGDASGSGRSDQGQRGDAVGQGRTEQAARADQTSGFDQNGRSDRGPNLERGDQARSEPAFPPDDIGNRVEGAEANGNGPNGERGERGGERRSRRGRRRGRRGGSGRGEGGNREGGSMGGSPTGGPSEGGSEDSFASQAAPVSQANGSYQQGGDEGQHHGGGESGGFEPHQREASSQPSGEASSQAREAPGQFRESTQQGREPSRSSGNPHLRDASRPHRSGNPHLRDASRPHRSGSRHRRGASRPLSSASQHRRGAVRRSRTRHHSRSGVGTSGARAFAAVSRAAVTVRVSGTSPAASACERAGAEPLGGVPAATDGATLNRSRLQASSSQHLARQPRAGASERW